MATNSLSSRRVVVVFGVGILLVTLMWNMECSMANNARGCHHGKNSGRGEECTSEDDHLGLYGDVDDTFKAKNPARPNHNKKHHPHHGGKHPHQDAGNDSPLHGHNNIHVLGH
ncbi:hypothetical protein PIB30_013584 [Stylosanthes scabra]|uniref:Uncharacterized protein n=1 Tax=Stylosanthes scabra TaxID=79078 RepID=A0ABU6T7Q6_9FABA|nr:hypothetical protein [Stylosanthes scabra]